LEDIGKRKYYKKWWFWVIGIVFIAVLFITPPKRTFAEKTAKTGPITPPAALESGTYLIGKDITAGEYVIIADSKASIQSYTYNIAFKSFNFADSGICRIVATLKDGDYLEVDAKTCNIYPIAAAPKADIQNGKLVPGFYIVGVDLPVGKYRVYDYTDSSFYVYKDSAINLLNTVSRNCYSGKSDITFKDGEVIRVFNQYIVLTPFSQINDTDLSQYEKESGKYEAYTTYESVIVADDGAIGYTWSFDKYQWYNYSNFQNRIIVTFAKNDEFELRNCTSYPIDHCPKVAVVDGKLPEGIYKVGMDFDEGSYTIVAFENSTGEYTIASDSYWYKSSIIESSSITGTQTISVKNGQYLRLKNAYIIINK